jgi:CubicO group peptidase (beta-lactamase class C family)
MKILVLLAALVAAQLHPVSSAAQDLPKLEADIAAVLESHGVPGASVAVVRGERIVWAQGIGVTEHGSAQRVTPDTLFAVASVSKPVAALGALRLVEQGKLALDTPVAKYLKSATIPAAGEVTLRQLLSHTAGLSVRGFRGYQRGAPIPTLAQILAGQPPANSSAVVLEGRPGAKYSYSGGGYCVVQQLVIDATGGDFAKAMSTLVLAPLGMAHSTFEQPLPEELISKAASGHDTRSRPVPGKWNVYPELAAAGLWTTASDLARYILAIQKAYAGERGALIGRDTAREMLRAQSDGGSGLGLVVSGEGAGGEFSHGGSNNGYRARMVASKSIGKGVVVLTNSDNGSKVHEPIQRLVDAAFEPRG